MTVAARLSMRANNGKYFPCQNTTRTGSLPESRSSSRLSCSTSFRQLAHHIRRINSPVRLTMFAAMSATNRAKPTLKARRSDRRFNRLPLFLGWSRNLPSWTYGVPDGMCYVAQDFPFLLEPPLGGLPGTVLYCP